MHALVLLALLAADPVADIIADAGMQDAGPQMVTACQPDAEVHFSPHGGCTELVVRLVNGAQRSIYLAAYDFTSKPIIEALAAAEKRGVHVAVLLDKRANLTNKHSGMAAMVDAGVDTLVDGAHPIMHDKYLVVDDERLELGSFNYSGNAEKNAENCMQLVLVPDLISKYEADWHAHAAHAKLPDGGSP